MNCELRVSDAAEADIAEAFDYYKLAEPGLELDFIECVEEGYIRIVRSPFSFPIVFGTHVRRALVERFPFAILFSVRGDLIFVSSLFHTSRNPSRWRGRID